MSVIPPQRSELRINLNEGSVSCGFDPQAAQELQKQISRLMQDIKAVAQSTTGGGKRQAYKPMEYQYTGEVFLEIFCNPNIYATPFAAKVLITLRDDRIRLTTETQLTTLVEDINSYLESY